MKYKCRRIRSVKLLFLSRNLHPLASLSMVLIISWALLLTASKTFGEPTQCLQVTPQHYRTYYGRLTLGSGVSYMRHNWISTLSLDPTSQGTSLWLCKYSNVQNPKVLLDLSILDKRDTTSPNRFSWFPQQERRLHFPPPRLVAGILGSFWFLNLHRTSPLPAGGLPLSIFSHARNTSQSGALFLFDGAVQFSKTASLLLAPDPGFQLNLSILSSTFGPSENKGLMGSLSAL